MIGSRTRRARRRFAVGTILFGLAGAGLSPTTEAAGAQSPPSIGAPSFILVEPSTGEVVFARHSRQPRLIASTTKLMTALLVLERVPLDRVFTSPGYSGVPAESTIHLRAGERMRVRDLLTALLLPSANDAAVTLARGTSGSSAAFVRAMNARARQLGLTRTHYENPIGLDSPGNRSTAADLVTLATRLRRFRFFDRTVDRSSARLHSGAVPRVVASKNTLLRSHPFVNGVKTGHTNSAGYLLVGSGTRDGVTVLSAVLGEPSESARNADTLALLNYGVAQYRSLAVLRPGQVLTTAHIRYQGSDRVSLVPARALTQVVRRGRRVRLRLRAPSELTGPLRAGARVGRVDIVVGGRVVARVGLVTAARVPRASVAARVGDWLGKPGTLAGLFVLVCAAIGLILTRRRRARRRGRRGIETEPA